MDLKEILWTVRINAINNYDTDKTINCRKVNDWGREEGIDLFIGLDRGGWILYTQVSHNLAGSFKIISENTLNMDDDYLANYFTSQESTNKEFMEFISKAFKYYPKI